MGQMYLGYIKLGLGYIMTMPYCRWSPGTKSLRFIHMCTLPTVCSYTHFFLLKHFSSQPLSSFYFTAVQLENLHIGKLEG